MIGVRALSGYVLFTLAAVASGCALTSRAEPSPWKYFTPERVQPRLESANIRIERGRLCLGRVTAGASLGRRIAYGNGGQQIEYYEDRRWTDEPERYARRALERALLMEKAFPCEVEPTPTKLDVELLSFEELKTKAGHAARVAFRAVVTTEDVIFDETIQEVDLVSGASFDDVVAAIGRALDQASTTVARRARVAASKDSTETAAPDAGARSD